jgi:hypothetical protein
MYQAHGLVTCQLVSAMEHFFTYIFRSKQVRYHHCNHKVINKEFLSTIPEKQEEPTIVHPRRRAHLARKWKRIKTDTRDDNTSCTTSRFQTRATSPCIQPLGGVLTFEVPLGYFGTIIFIGLLRRYPRRSFGSQITRDGTDVLRLLRW